MRLSRRALRMAGGQRAASHEANINLVPMIDILTVLVLYLLVGSIASHLAILKLNLPAPNQPTPEKPPLSLTILVKHSELDVGDANGVLQALPNTPNGYNLAALGDFLSKVKAKNPEETSVTILMEQDLPYETLVKVMDTARVYPEDATGTSQLREMFPNISIGDAPATSPAPANAPTAASPPAATP
ncbi:MAG TPA: biopolymer transporter ExbD [Nevskiaceae bacterium]|nr:biopolymer transporter ExbD [Nevskiaceae bacterium]